MSAWLPVSSDKVTDRPIKTFDPENKRVEVGIVFLATPEADIPLEYTYTSQSINQSINQAYLQQINLNNQALTIQTNIRLQANLKEA